MDKKKIYSFLREGVKTGTTVRGAAKIYPKATIIIFNTQEYLYVVSTAGTCMKVARTTMVGEPSTAIILRNSTIITPKGFLSTIRDWGFEAAIDCVKNGLNKEEMEEVKKLMPLCVFTGKINNPTFGGKTNSILLEGHLVELVECGNFKYADYMIERSKKLGEPIYQSEDGLLYFKKSYKDFTFTSIDFSVKTL